MSCHFYKLRRIERMKKIMKALEQTETTTICEKETIEQSEQVEESVEQLETVEQSVEQSQETEQKTKKTSKK